MSVAATKETLQSQLEHLQAKYVGTGHADTTRYEWASNQHRDSYASYIGHAHMSQYFALAQNESVGRTRYEMMEKMVLPLGPRPAAQEHDEEEDEEEDEMNE
eukprot:TRINITY_DN5275_c0_g1_i1.p2 TRINITY_DN5275_c0_g1~~TRINITY_DN5275_c0_g1_i1.p2  ORF type:complete len:102 (-),score=22.96 TRINITY_DN5275_c0_g1_i1:58-363(-)